MDAGAKGKTYKIGQAAKLLDVKPFVLRFWEGEFRHVLVPVRTPAGQRAYTEANVATVREIKRLLYEEGLTIEGAKKRLGQHQGKATPAPSASPALPASLASPPSPSDDPGPSVGPGPGGQLSLPGGPKAACEAVSGAVNEAAREAAQATALRAALRDVQDGLLSLRDFLAERDPQY